MESKNQTKSLEFRKEDEVSSNVHNNVLTNEQHWIWKRRNKVKVALATGAAVVGVGGGIGIGYAIPGVNHTHNVSSLTIVGAPTDPIEGTTLWNLTTDQLSCTIGKNNTPLTSVAYSASNLPEGLNIAKDTGIISGVPTTPTNSAMTSTIIATYINDDERLFGSTTITFNISNTLIISATRLLADENLRNNCNLQINDGALNKVSEWNEDDVNTKFTTYLNSLGNFRTTAIQFEGVGSIATRAFESCVALKDDGAIENIKFVESPIGDSYTIGSYAFCECTKLKTIDLSSTNITSIGEFAFAACTALTTINFPNTLESIGQGAFANCIAITAINFPDSLESIGDGALARCGVLTTIDFPISLKSIGIGAFNGCVALTTVDLSPCITITSIDELAFYGCVAKTITFPASLESIDQGAFYRCTELTTIDLSDTRVVSVGGLAFYECTKLVELHFSSQMFTAENNASIDTQAFKGCAGLNAIYLPDDAVAIPKNCTDDAFQNCPTNGTIYYSGSESGLANDFKAKFGGLNGWSVS